jgi:hypothetical protein
LEFPGRIIFRSFAVGWGIQIAGFVVLSILSEPRNSVAEVIGNSVGLLFSGLPGGINGIIGASSSSGVRTGRHRVVPVLLLPILLFLLTMFAGGGHLDMALLVAIPTSLLAWISGRVGQEIGIAYLRKQSPEKFVTEPSENTLPRALFLGPAAFGLMGASAGVCRAMLFRYVGAARACVEIEDSFPLFFGCLVTGVVTGCGFAVIYEWSPGRRRLLTVLALVLLGTCVVAPLGWIVGEQQIERYPRLGMVLGSVCGALIGLLIGLLQLRMDTRVPS